MPVADAAALGVPGWLARPVPFIEVAVGVLLARFSISQMDVPTRQAYVVAVVDPEERTAAAAYTNTARYVVRPFGPLLAGPIITVSLGAPFVIAGVLKSVYDLGLYAVFRNVTLPDDDGNGRGSGRS